MKPVYVVWEYVIVSSNGLRRQGAKNTLMDLEDINTNHIENPGTMDQIDWLNAGLFFDDIIKGNREVDLEEGEEYESICVYGFYRDHFESREAFQHLSHQVAKTNIPKTDGSLN